jgi:tetratricopeptide (TPR) repeat protein
MTVAAKDGFGARRGYAGAGHPWRRLWQVPLLLAGIVGFGYGVRALVRTIKPIPFARQVQGVEGLLNEQKYGEAIQQINLLAPYYKDAAQQAELEKLAGDAIFLAQRQQVTPVRANYEAVATHYQRALAWGLAPTVEMNERWGETALALGDAELATEKLEAAIADTSGESAVLQRYVRNLTAAYLETSQRPKALALVNRLLEGKPGESTDAQEQYTWGLCKRIEIVLGMNAPAAVEHAVTEARAALSTLKERDPGGRVLVWIGRAELDRGQLAAAERDLGEARRRFAVHHLDDGRAAILLGKILESRGDLAGAEGLFKEVAASQVGTSIWAAARLGRAEIAVRRGMLDSAAMLDDYRYVIAAVKDDQSPVGRKPELLGRENVRTSLLDAYQRAWDGKETQAALTFLALEQRLEESESPENVLRRAVTRERRGQEMMTEAQKADPAARPAALAAGRAMLADAADDYLRHSKMTTLLDEESGNSLWKAGTLLDAAGQTMRAAAVFERFTIQRPRDPRQAEGLLTLGQLYESAGMPDKALTFYERNLKENPKTPAAYAAVVGRARCYAALAAKAARPEDKQTLLDKAEATLLSLVQENTDLQPSAREFRESLLALGDLYYANGRWADAVLRLDEVLTRYPNDPAVPRVTFMLAQSYRKSAADIAEALKNPAIERRSDLERARTERLLSAAGYFSRVISLLDVEAMGIASATIGQHRPLTELEEQYLRSSYLDRAECLFLRGDYDQAIKLYDETAARFPEEVLAVEAYVQIVNAYWKLNQPALADAAAQRGQRVLQRVPDAAFGDSGPKREYFARLLALQ